MCVHALVYEIISLEMCEAVRRTLAINDALSTEGAGLLQLPGECLAVHVCRRVCGCGPLWVWALVGVNVGVLTLMNRPVYCIL